jgi:translocation protein SEC63
LTDPIARDNFAKYGNPDGMHHVNVGIALPETLSRKDQQIFVLVMFFLGFNAINSYFYFDLTKEEKDLGGVSMKNRDHFNYLIDHDTMGKKKIPAILG